MHGPAVRFRRFLKFVKRPKPKTRNRVRGTVSSGRRTPTVRARPRPYTSRGKRERGPRGRHKYVGQRRTDDRPRHYYTRRRRFVRFRRKYYSSTLLTAREAPNEFPMTTVVRGYVTDERTAVHRVTVETVR